MHDDRAEDRVRRPVALADAAFGVEHAAFVGAKRRGLAEDLPLAGGASPPAWVTAVYSGKFRAKRLTSAPGRVVQLHRGGQALACERGLLPDEECAVGARWTLGRGAAADVFAQRQRIDLFACLRQALLQRLVVDLLPRRCSASR